jgi:chromate transporter
MALSLAAAVAIFRFKASTIATLLACAAAGMVWTLVAP